MLGLGLDSFIFAHMVCRKIWECESRLLRNESIASIFFSVIMM